MTGIMGMLEELTGQAEIKNKAQVMEYGDRQFIIYPGILGNTILLVKKAAPILKKLSKQFTIEYELIYEHHIKENVSLNGFAKVGELASKYFGKPIEKFQEK